MKKLITILLAVAIFFRLGTVVLATSPEIAKGLDYLKTKQDSSGKITGFGGESQWAAIAFSANGLSVDDIMNPDLSLKTFLLSDPPAASASATEWERRILAIVAVGDNPANFGGVNYVQNLEGLAKENQLGETNLLNDDIFGLLALVASGPLSNQTIKQNSLDFIIAHQANDGGYSWSADSSCAWCGSDSNDTAAALQALQAAKQSGLTNTNLDSAIDKAKTYLLTTRKSNGGFAYDSFSDADGASTSWSLMALNALGLGDTEQAQQAKSWLISNQESDGGFHWMAGYGSDTATTSHAVVALNGKSWILQIYSPTATPSASPTSTPTPLPTVTPTPTPTPSPTSTPEPTPTPTPSPTPTSPTPTPVRTLTSTKTVAKTTPTSDPEVLGVTDETNLTNSGAVTKESPSLKPKADTDSQNEQTKREIALGLVSIGGVILLIIGLKIWENRKEK